MNNSAGNTALERMKRAMLQPLVSFSPGSAVTGHPILLGWVEQPLVEVTVNGRPAREVNVNLFLAHLFRR
jgi:hypothetical protein